MVRRVGPPEWAYPHHVEHEETDECLSVPVCPPVNPNEIVDVKPNHFFNDTLGDPATCTENHNHPPRATYDPPPKHYFSSHGIDPWAVWDAFDLDRYTANAVKYLLRAGKKDIAPRLDDLIKARNYINKAIEMEESRSE